LLVTGYRLLVDGLPAEATKRSEGAKVGYRLARRSPSEWTSSGRACGSGISRYNAEIKCILRK